MGEQKWTPGPWRVHVDSRSGIGRTSAVYVCTAGEWPDAQVARVSAMDGYDEREANAGLLAAAPDLFEALKDYRQRFYTAVIATGSADAEIATLACAKADAALAKALGEKGDD